MSDAAAPDAVQPTAGALLRQAREDAGLHMASLAGILKVPQRQLEALEQDRLDQLPDVVYARALAASVCRNLKVDPRAILERLPRGGDSRLGQGEPINLPFRSADAVQPGWMARLRGRPAMVIAVLLLLGAAALLVLPLWEGAAPAEDATHGAVPMLQVPAAAPAGQAEPGDSATGPAGPAMPAAADPRAAAAPEGAPVSAGAPEGAPVSAGAPEGAAVSAAAPPAAAGAALLEFRASEPSWVSVIDARGTVLLRRILAAGEQVPVNGVAPLSVTVGSASGMQVLVRGQPLELKPARDNVARFEVR